MEKALQCECGFEARAEDEDRLVEEVQRHAWDVHGMPLSRHEALLLAFRAGLDEEAPLTIFRQETGRAERKEEK